MEKSIYPLRSTLSPTLKGTIVGAIPGTIVGAAVPAIIGFALLGLTTPHRVTTYFTAYLWIIMFGALVGAAIGGSMGACRWVEKGCPQIQAAQMRRTAVAGALLALPLAILLWTAVRELVALLFE